MTVITLPFPNINPVALSLGPFEVKWYGIAYAAGLLLGWQYIKRMLADTRLWPSGKAPYTAEQTDDLMLFMTLGVILGGRLGEVLFWNPAYYFSNPAEIFKPWKGGMAFHGGFVGSIVAILYFAYRHKGSALSALDLCAAATPIGLLFGRLANFINAELWGRPSAVPWAMVFPDRDAGNVPRHPSQLYEAGLEGLALLGICWWLIHRRDALKMSGLVAGTFTAGYGAARAFCEIFREPDSSHWATGSLMTGGILYSLPMIALGLFLIHRARAASNSTAA